MHGSHPQTLATWWAGGQSPGQGLQTWGPPGLLNPNSQGKTRLAWWTPRPGSLRVRQAGGREHPPRARWSPGGAPEPKLAGEDSPGPVDSQVSAPRGTAGRRKGVPVPGPGRGQEPGQSSLNTAMHGSPPQTLSRVPCHLVGRRAKSRTGVPNTIPAGASDPKLTGESLLGLVDSQAWAPHGMAGWRKGVARHRAQLGLSEYCHAGEALCDPVPGALPHGGLEDKA
ncbi:hypothetical protein NDU88_006227 [Pleurodeles waltl]|uniref:Uncharacterized protein n=1 Tax=Pleurodeles waltl TaxID=8319 RepID=A0AAV7UPD8_PLEWA|nr:hypothetical protein NDU88_006227 [Pleurodeles waltl]